MVNEPFQNSNFSVSRVGKLMSARMLSFWVAAREWRIRQNDIERLARITALERRGQRIKKLDTRFFQVREVQIQNRNLDHIRVVVESRERLLFQKFP